MYLRKRRTRLWAAIPSVVLIVVVIVSVGLAADAATYTTQISLGAARPFAVLAAAAVTANAGTVTTPPVASLAFVAPMLTMSVAPADVWDAPTATVAVGVTAVQIPVAAPLIPRLPATSTSDESGPPLLLGFLLGLFGVLAIFVWRKSVAARVIHIFTR